MTSPRAYALVALGLATALSGCASSTEQTQDETSATEVAVVNIAYDPETLTIEPGTEVVWVNEDESVHHTVTSGTPGDNGVPGVSKGNKSSPDGVFDGDLPDTSSEFSFTFDKAGNYKYFCEVHPSMTGEVVVE